VAGRTLPAVFYHRDGYMLFREGEAILGSTMEYGVPSAGHRGGPTGIVKALSAVYPPLASTRLQRSSGLSR
jgi:hypothetical protein